MTTHEIIGMVFGGGLLGSVIGVGSSWGVLRRTVEQHERALLDHERCLDRVQEHLTTIRTQVTATSRDVAWLVDAVKRNGGGLR